MKCYNFYIFIHGYLAAISFVIRKLKSQKNSDIPILYLKATTYSDNGILPQHVGSRPELKSCLLNPFHMLNNLLILFLI